MVEEGAEGEEEEQQPMRMASLPWASAWLWEGLALISGGLTAAGAEDPGLVRAEATEEEEQQASVSER